MSASPIARTTSTEVLQSISPWPLGAVLPVTPSVAPEQRIEPAKYFSPVVRFDDETHAAVLQYRDTLTGEPIRQFPSAKTSELYRPSASD